MKKIFLSFLILISSLQVFGQNTEAQNLTIINVVRNNTLSPARVANALDALNYSKQGILQAYTASGTDIYAVTGPTAITAYASGQIVIVTFTNANTGAATLNINSTGAVDLKDNEGNALSAGEIAAGATYIFKHNGTSFWMVGASGGVGGGSGTVNSGTQYRIAHYATTGTAVSEAAAITAARVLISDANGVPTHSTVTTTTLGFLDATSSIQTQLNSKGSTIGTHDRYISAAELWPRNTAGCSLLTPTEMATSIFNVQTLDFDPSTQEFAQGQIVLPKSWNNGTVTATVYWTATTTGSGGVVWGVSLGAYSDDDALTVALGTAQTTSDTFITINDLHKTSATSAITVAGTPADADFLAIQISRNPADGSDTFAQDAKLLGIVLTYTTDADTD